MKKEKIRTSEEIYKIIRDLFFENIVFRDYYDSCTFLKLICPLQRNITSDFYRPWSLTKIMIYKEGLVCYIDTPGCYGWYAYLQRLDIDLKKSLGIENFGVNLSIIF